MTDVKLINRKLTPQMLETAAHNLCADFGVEFVKANEAFARAVWDEFWTAAPTPESDSRKHIAAKALAFFEWARDQFWTYDSGVIDACDFQDEAERLGLIRPVPFDPTVHFDAQGLGLEAGDQWFETDPDVRAALARQSASDTDREGE